MDDLHGMVLVCLGGSLGISQSAGCTGVELDQVESNFGYVIVFCLDKDSYSDSMIFIL